MSEPSPLRRFWGHALLTVGILWCVLCGGCTLIFSLQMFGAGGLQATLMWIGLCVLIGGICAIPGLAFLLLGRLILSRGR